MQIEETQFVANKALASTRPEIVALSHEANSYSPVHSEVASVPDIDEETENASIAQYINTKESGHGGGISINLLRSRPFIILEIILQDVSFFENAAVVGGRFRLGICVWHLHHIGGISVQTTQLHKSVENNVSCASASAGFDTCQRVFFRNVTIVRNKAEFAGGLFASSLDWITFSCGPNATTWTKNTHDLSKAMVDQQHEFCSEISNNSLINASSTQAADLGTRVAKLVVKGQRDQLKEMASGDNLTVVCEDIDDEPCTGSLEIVVKDAFNQSIERGLDDASLELTLSSEAIVGDHRYRAVNGTVVIDSTRVYGVNVTNTLTITAEGNRDVYLQLNLTTRECYPGEAVQSDHCVACADDKYGFDPSQEDCRNCEEHARCSGGAVLVPIAGYWHSTPFSPTFCKCIDQKACQYEGRTENLTAFYKDAAVLKSRLDDLDDVINEGQMFSEYRQCLEGYDGPLCGSCQPGYGHSHSYECKACPQGEAIGLRFTLIAVWLFVVIGLNCVITLMTTNARVAFAKRELQERIIAQRRVLERAEHIHAVLTRVSHAASGELGMSRSTRSLFDALYSPLATSSSIGTASASDRILRAQQLTLAITLTEILKVVCNELCAIRKLSVSDSDQLHASHWHCITLTD